uniref:Uncharacterized protein n=1 Tax=Anguilla anguilla TaxID=7936 RepID=A0A0E9TB41_ANGAN
MKVNTSMIFFHFEASFQFTQFPAADPFQ